MVPWKHMGKGPADKGQREFRLRATVGSQPRTHGPSRVRLSRLPPQHPNAGAGYGLLSVMGLCTPPSSQIFPSRKPS